MLETKYIRELNSQILVMTLGKLPAEDYQVPMLLQNHIDGIVPVQSREENGITKLCYDVTSLEPLTDVYLSEKLAPERILRLFLFLNHTVEELDRYLLRGAGLVLDPLFIFQSKADGKILFCYNPCNESRACDELNLLARFVLDHIDYKDRETVELAYMLFQDSMKESVTLQGFIQMALKRLEMEKTREQEEERIREETQGFFPEHGAREDFDERAESDIRPESRASSRGRQDRGMKSVRRGRPKGTFFSRSSWQNPGKKGKNKRREAALAGYSDERRERDGLFLQEAVSSRVPPDQEECFQSPEGDGRYYVQSVSGGRGTGDDRAGRKNGRTEELIDAAGFRTGEIPDGDEGRSRQRGVWDSEGGVSLREAREEGISVRGNRRGAGLPAIAVACCMNTGLVVAAGTMLWQLWYRMDMAVEASVMTVAAAVLVFSAAEWIFTLRLIERAR